MINFFEVRRWISRRITTFDHHNLHWPRNTPKHFGLFAFILSLIFFYFLLSRSFRSNKIISARHCVADFLEKNGIRQPWDENGKTLEDWQQNDKMAFVGNGFIGLETYADRKLMIFANDSGGTRPYNLLTGFSPLVDVAIPLAIEESIVFTDNNGMARNVRCSVLSEKCVCVVNSVYAHRTRPGLLVQHVQLVNPSSSTFTVSFKTRNSAFEQREGHHSPIYTKTFDEGKSKALVVIMCTSSPKTGITLKPKIEENFRFICYLEKGPAGNEAALISSVSAKFGAIFALKSDQIDAEHEAAWETLNSVNFSLSHSKVPNSLNQFAIDKMRTLLLSSMPFDTNAFGANKNSIILDSAYCFTGISTMLTPSKLWQKSLDLASLLRQIDIWKTTLEHRGCSTLIKKYGAHGFAQAFLLSLSAAMFSNGAKRLEFALNPQTELQRNIKIDGLRIGVDAVVSLEFQLDLGLKPFVIIQNRNPTQTLYACTAGCQESPHSIGKEPIKLPIKMTRPTTSILFLSQHIYELELLKKTLHVNEIFDAPAHDQDKIDLHKHGHAGEGLPTIFWVILVFMLIAFHLFLFKLLYSEWQNSSTMPYSKFNKKVLFRR